MVYYFAITYSPCMILKLIKQKRRMLAVLKTNDGTYTVTIAGDVTPYTFNSSHPNYTKLIEALKAQDGKAIKRLYDVAATVKKYTKGKLEFRAGAAYYDGEQLRHVVVDKILELMRDGLPFKPLVLFLEKLMRNPSKTSVDQLYNFIEKHGINITEEGDILLYKRVRDDWKDFHSGSVCNEVGKTVELARNKISDDPNLGCHYGLHAGARSYVLGFNSGGHIVCVQASPEDVVCVPRDCDWAKIRLCKYFVREEIGEEEMKAAVYKHSGKLEKCETVCFPDDDCDDDDYGSYDDYDDADPDDDYPSHSDSGYYAS